MYFLYSSLLTLTAVISSPHWFVKGLSQKKHLGNVGQRFGWKLPFEKIPGKPLWLHAVSVGEVLAAKALFSALRRTDRPFLPRSEISDGTPGGAEILLLDTIGALRAVYSSWSWEEAFCRLLGDTIRSSPPHLGKRLFWGRRCPTSRKSHVFLQEKAARQCSSEDLSTVLLEQLKNTQARNLLGERAMSTLGKNQGPTEKTMKLLLPYLP